jgi:hypothetical protein
LLLQVRRVDDFDHGGVSGPAWSRKLHAARFNNQNKFDIRHSQKTVLQEFTLSILDNERRDIVLTYRTTGAFSSFVATEAAACCAGRLLPDLGVFFALMVLAAGVREL